MYELFFGFTGKPFSVAPDQRPGCVCGVRVRRYVPPACEDAALRSLSMAWSPPLTAVDQCTQTARLRTLDAPTTAVREVPLTALTRDWRTPPGWCEDRNTLAGNAAPAGAMSERLRAFGGAGTGPRHGQVFALQIAQGLVPDGLAGPQTLMLLGRATGVDELRLAQR